MLDPENAFIDLPETTGLGQRNRSMTFNYLPRQVDLFHSFAETGRPSFDFNDQNFY